MLQILSLMLAINVRDVSEAHCHTEYRTTIFSESFTDDKIIEIQLQTEVNDSLNLGQSRMFRFQCIEVPKTL